MLRYLGFARPYRFERAVPAALATLCAVFVVIVGGVMYRQGELLIGGPRSFYFLYVLVLLGVVALLAKWPRLSATALLLAILETTLGVGGHLLGDSSLLPESFDTSGRFRWHVLLQATPKPSLSTTLYDGSPLHHSAEGTRGRDRSPADLAGKTVIATFGGSSSYDLGIGDGETWPERLEEALGADRYAVINHGVPGYSTVEHVIQTAFYQTKFGVPPRCAIYYVGWNDIRNAHIKKLDPGYADFHLPAQVDGLRTRRVGGAHVYFSPVLTELARLVSNQIDTVQYGPSIDGETMAGSDPALEALFERNVRTISAVNRGRNIRTVWVGQLLNRARLTGDGKYGWLPYVRDRDVWPLQARFNTLLGETARSLSDVFVGLPIEDFGAADFVDQGHFSDAGALKFAARLAPAIREACR